MVHVEPVLGAVILVNLLILSLFWGWCVGKAKLSWWWLLLPVIIGPITAPVLTGMDVAVVTGVILWVYTLVWMLVLTHFKERLPAIAAWVVVLSVTCFAFVSLNLLNRG